MQTVFSVKLRKHTKNCADIFEGLINLSGTQVFSRDGRQPEAEEFYRLDKVHGRIPTRADFLPCNTRNVPVLSGGILALCQGLRAPRGPLLRRWSPRKSMDRSINLANFHRFRDELMSQFELNYKA